MSVHKQEIALGDETISIETGNWAKQAHGSIVYRIGDLVLLATVCAADEAREGQDFFPLTVDYREKTYSVGRIPGGYIKREARPADHEVLLSRLIDRPIRPLFPEGYFSEVQLLLTVLSADKEINIEGHAITAASAALTVSDIPFSGPIAGVVVGRINGEFILNPTHTQLAEESDLELVVAGSKDAVAMIEGEAKELTNEEILAAIEYAHENIRKLLDGQTALASTIGVEKREVSLRLPDEGLKKEVFDFALDKMKTASSNTDKMARGTAVTQVYRDTLDHFKTKLADNTEIDINQTLRDVKTFVHDVEADVVRGQIFDNKVRADGRSLDEIRDISCELDVLPGTHGSAIFTRGQTQSLGTATLGTLGDNQRYENLAGQHHKNFMLHYNFPPYSVGETKRLMGPGRREIGHGQLAERALKAMVPGQDEFPYVIRLVSEILESNGSSSMASVCSGSMAMMTAGVPIARPVSGIAMGLITGEDGKYAILSDIAGIEDHFGDMDFKVAGSEKGITALQLDIKVTGISIEIMREALAQAETGRMHILGKMNEAIDKSRSDVPDNAPRITTLQIDPDRIGELIGPGGKVIRSIIEETGTEINVDDSGTVTVAAVDGDAATKAIDMIEGIFADVEVGTIYKGKVTRIADFGAFVQVMPGKEGLCHISKLDVERVTEVRDVVDVGDEIEVKVIGVDRQGRIDLSRKEVLAPGSGGGDRGGRGGDRGGRGDRSRDDRGGRGGDRGGRGGDRGGRDRDRGGRDRAGSRR